MSSELRDALTLVVLALVAIAAVFFLLAERDSSWVLRFTGRSRGGPIQRYLSAAMRFLAATAILFFLTFESLITPPPEVRALLFVVACLLLASAAYSMWRGYRLWRAGIEGKGAH